MNKNDLQGAKRLCMVSLLIFLIAASVEAQMPVAGGADNRSDSTRMLSFVPRFRFSLAPSDLRLTPVTYARTNALLRSNAISFIPMAAGPNLQVIGSGTLGRLTKWTGFTSSNSFIGDSTIFESKTGLIGVGTDAPTSKLTVAGMIQSTIGGFKFPDGTVQTSAAITGLESIFHDSTLQGDGTSGSPLGVAIPLFMTGAVDDGNSLNGAEAVLDVTNTGFTGAGIIARGNSIGVVGLSDGVAVLGQGNDRSGSGFRGGSGVFGGGGAGAEGNGGIGVIARGGEGNGVGNEGGIGIEVEAGEGKNGATNGLAGRFTGDVLIDGNLNVTGTKNFKIDHPLDPENKYLYHAAIESSEVLNIYSGNVTTNEKGDATVALPEWFEAINCDFRYQLTVVGIFSQAIVADEIRNNRFTIKTSVPGVKVSWQVTGIRSDRAARKTPFKVEEEKPQSERGFYLSPEAFGQPEERSVNRARGR